MFLLVLVSLFVGLCKNYLTDFHEMQRKGGTWATEETIRFWVVTETDLNYIQLIYCKK